jgi:predicted component of viral defense system (DUF524 family)
MTEKHLNIPIYVQHKNVVLSLYGENSGETLIEINDAVENGEAPFQIKEGCYYEYKITNGFSLRPSEIVSQSKVNDSSGRISPNIYVGTLTIDVLDSEKIKCGEVKLEVQSVKINYREDYRHMLEEITEKCSDLLLQHSSPVSQYFKVDFNADAKTLYQRFAFIKSILESVEFNDSVHKIISAPVTRWKESEIIKDIRSVKRFNNSAIRQLASAGNRIDLPNEHPLKNRLQSIPSKIKVSNKTETVDTPENRFVKYALVYFQSFCGDFKTKAKDSDRIKTEAALLEDKLEQYLSHSIFKEISSPTTLPLNSPVLQRKEGYREILRVWLMFDLAAKMIWYGGDDVYSGNKRDVAVLYEYWLFFKLLEIIKEVFKIEPKNIQELIKDTKDGLGLQLRQGNYFPIEGIYESATRKLNIEFGYNRAFSGKKDYPLAGSWTKNMRPDYTLSIWPVGISQTQAEIEELIVHIHFDAKYKVDKLTEIFGEIKSKEQTEEDIQKELSSEKAEQIAGNFKRADLLKMHSYKDAIRRTGGAYILYPGDSNEKPYNKSGFHELIPGLGAFAIRPSKSNNGIEELKKFLNEVVAHFMNRASHREKISLKTYETYKGGKSNELNEALPETYGANRSLIPDETFVLVAYYKKENWDWILKTGLFNTRAGSSRGSLKLGPHETGAKYILLHSSGETQTGKLFKVRETGPRIFSRKTLERINYPKDSKKQGQYYLVYKVAEVKDEEFLNLIWDITKLDSYKKGRSSALPFSTTMTELMKTKIKL